MWKVHSTTSALECCTESARAEDEGAMTANFDKTSKHTMLGHMRRTRVSKNEFAPPRCEIPDWRREIIHDSHVGEALRGKEVERSYCAVKTNEASNHEFGQKLKIKFLNLFDASRQ